MNIEETTEIKTQRNLNLNDDLTWKNEQFIYELDSMKLKESTNGTFTYNDSSIIFNVPDNGTNPDPGVYPIKYLLDTECLTLIMEDRSEAAYREYTRRQ